MWNKSVSLFIGQKAEKDAEGYPVSCQEEWLSGIPANFLDVTREDEILAKQAGYTANLRIRIAACNYHGEKMIKDEATGERYEVKRSFQKDKGQFVELICERRDLDG